jgi:hypothetical protein
MNPFADNLIAKSGAQTDAAIDLAREAQDIANRAIEQRDELAEALRDVFALLDEGWLVRDTSHDHREGFAIRVMPLVQRLSKARAALAKLAKLQS